MDRMKRFSPRYYDIQDSSTYPVALGDIRPFIAQDCAFGLKTPNYLAHIAEKVGLERPALVDDLLNGNFDGAVSNLLLQRDLKVFKIDAHNRKASRSKSGTFRLEDKTYQKMRTLTGLSAMYGANQIDFMIDAAFRDALAAIDKGELVNRDKYVSCTKVVIPFAYVGEVNASHMLTYVENMVETATQRFAARRRCALDWDDEFQYRVENRSSVRTYRFGNIPHRLVISFEGFDLSLISSAEYPYNVSGSTLMTELPKPPSFGVNIISEFAQTGYSPFPHLATDAVLVQNYISALAALLKEASVLYSVYGNQVYLSTAYYVDLIDHTAAFSRLMTTLKSPMIQAVLKAKGIDIKHIIGDLQKLDLSSFESTVIDVVTSNIPDAKEIFGTRSLFNSDLKATGGLVNEYSSVDPVTAKELGIDPKAVQGIDPVQFNRLGTAERLSIFRCSELGLDSSKGVKLQFLTFKKNPGLSSQSFHPAQRLSEAGRTRGELSRGLFVARNVIYDIMMSTGVVAL